jgi:nicotinate (nicotinamide) nucleotide adenylyltransferase
MSRAVFLGSFDPPHKGHRDAILSVVNSDVMRRCNIEKLHVIVAQQNPNKPKSTPFIDRYKMCLAMFGDIDNVLVDDIENQVKPQYTFDLFKRFHHNEDDMITSDFWWIITTETIDELIKGEWYKSITMLCENKFIVIVKNDEEIKHIKGEINLKEGQVNFVKLQSTCDAHSSHIRQQCKDGNIEALNNTNEYIKDYIIQNKLYF